MHLLVHSSIHWWLALVGYCCKGFCFCWCWFPCRNQQPFSPTFQRVTTVLLHCFPQDRYRQQTARTNTILINKHVTNSNKKPTSWWGRQNAAPLKFNPKLSEAAFWTVFSNFHKCRRASLMPSYLRGSKLGRDGCRVKFDDSSTHRSPDIRTTHFVMDDERRHWTKVNTYGRTPFCLKIQLLVAAYYPHNVPHLTDNQWYFVLTYKFEQKKRYFGDCIFNCMLQPTGSK